LTLRILFIALLILRLGSAQVLQPHESGIAQTQRGRLVRKQAVERHFESIEPRPRPQFDGAVPGSTLLEEHRLAAAKVRARVRASLAAQPQAQSGSTALPCILSRPAISTATAKWISLSPMDSPTIFGCTWATATARFNF
jgi:hypothetical protein